MTKIIDLVNEEKLTVYDVQKIIEALVQRNVLNGFITLDETVAQDVESAINTLKKSYLKLETLVDEYRKSLDMVYEKLEDDYKDKEGKIKALNEKLHDLSRLHVPEFYQFKQLIELVDKYSTLTEDGRNLFDSLVKVKLEKKDKEYLDL